MLPLVPKNSPKTLAALHIVHTAEYLLEEYWWIAAQIEPLSSITGKCFIFNTEKLICDI